MVYDVVLPTLIADCSVATLTMLKHQGASSWIAKHIQGKLVYNPL
jgi:hypothetical protein